MNIQFLLDNALTILTSSTLFGIVGWFFGGKQQKQRDLKKTDVEIESAEVDYAVKVKELYESLLQQANDDKTVLKVDKDNIIIEFRNEKDYFRSQIDELRKQAAEMQNQFNTIQLAYTREVEVSQNWEKLHRELMAKHDALAKDHEELKAFCEKLKLELDKYKKQK